MAGFLRFGSPQYFQALDQQVNAALAPQMAAGIIKQQEANEIRAKAQRHAHNNVSKLYGRSKYNGAGDLVRDVGQVNEAQQGRVAMPYAVCTSRVEQEELLRLRKQRSKSKARRQRMKKAA